mmetsp:Transcript_20447/g.48463  ORF Transcript_20447/g.48463 Transcript_20447/m.48463 type:complete len:137 (-) Transcript_20447:148-558(-)
MVKLTPPMPIQDVAPKGGYAPIKTARNIPKGGASTLVMVTASAFIYGWGMYKIIQANRTRRVWRREEEDIRLATMPFLTAENDVRTAYLMQKVNANEAEVMKAVPDWEAGGSVYKTRWAAPMELQGQLYENLLWRK